MSVYKTIDSEVTRKLALSKLNAFDLYSHGQIFWNFRTELEVKWDYQRAVDIGWLPSDFSNPSYIEAVQLACGAEYSMTEGMSWISGKYTWSAALLVIAAAIIYCLFYFSSKRLQSTNHVYLDIPTIDKGFIN